MPSALLPRNLLRVAGDDAGPFLDAILTRDVSLAGPDSPMYAALLSPQGKIVADVFVHRDTRGAFLLDIDASQAAGVHAKLLLLRLRKKVTLEEVPDQCVVADFASGVADPRFPDGALGARRVCTIGAQCDLHFKDYEMRRIRLGAPDPARDAAPEEVFALEALLEELNGVDFQKGCFIGQENVSRMKRRATTRRKFCRIAFEGAPPAWGAPVTAGGATLGEVRSGVEGAAIALLRLDRAQATSDPLMAGDIQLRLDPPPFLILPPSEDA